MACCHQHNCPIYCSCFVALRFDDVLTWKTADGKLASHAFCATHKGMCPLPTGHRKGMTFRVEGAGASCVPFSVAGKTQKAILEFVLKHGGSITIACPGEELKPLNLKPCP